MSTRCRVLWRSLTTSCFVIAEVRAYIYEALTYLVQIHAQISEVARPVLDRTLNAIVDQIVQDALGFFRQVKRFGMGGMLRVRFSSTLLYTAPLVDSRMGCSRLSPPTTCAIFSFMSIRFWPQISPLFQVLEHLISPHSLHTGHT
jgi:hypothetical protein